MARIKRNTSYSVSVEEAVDQYISHCKSRNLSAVTLDTYSRHLKWLYLYMDCKSIDSVTVQDLELMIEKFLDEHHYNSTKSINNFKRYINTFFKWCKRNKLITEDVRLEYSKHDHKLQRVPSDGDVKRLTTKPNINYATYNDLLGWCVCSIICSTGLRIGAITNIKIGDIDFDSNTIKITKAKNRRETVVIINRKLKQVLKEFMSITENESEYLFENREGLPYKANVMSMNIIRYARSKNIECSPHDLRRWFSITYIRNGGSIFGLKNILNHSDIQTTQLYLQSCNVQTFEKELEQYNPLDNLKG